MNTADSLHSADLAAASSAPSPFRMLHHICVVVHDLDRTVAAYESLGIGPWFDYPKGEEYIELFLPNKAGSDALRYRCCNLENFQLQVCQPSEHDTPQRRFLLEHGEGVYHFGFEVPNLSEAIDSGCSAGLSVLAKGIRADRSGFCYFDTRDKVGVVLEVRKSPKVASEGGASLSTSPDPEHGG